MNLLDLLYQLGGGRVVTCGDGDGGGHVFCSKVFRIYRADMFTLTYLDL